MGSGHFLNRALNFLTNKYLDALELEKLSEEIPTKAEAKRIILYKCIFGGNWTGDYEIKSGDFPSKSNFIASAGLTPFF